MKTIEHWDGVSALSVAESAGGVLATLDPLSNVIRAGVRPWPAPELIQKLYASERWRGRTDDDTRAVAATLGHYTDLQSLNSEDAVTWSFFGPMIHGVNVTGNTVWPNRTRWILVEWKRTCAGPRAG